MSDRAQGYVLPENNDWDLTELVGSLRNVPVRNFIGTYDALVPVGHDPDRLCDALEALEYDHDCWRDISSGGTHRGYENDRAAEIAQLLAEHRLDPDPAHVTYLSHPVFRRQAADTGLSHLLRYDRAYWVGGIRWPAPHIDGGCATTDCLGNPGIPTFPTDPGTPRRLLSGERISSIDVRTYGGGVADPVATPIEDDPSPTLLRRGIVLRPGDTADPVNAFDLSVKDVIGLDLDLGRMKLTLDAPLAGTVVGEGPLELGLVGAVDGCSATLNGHPQALRREGDRLTMTLVLRGGPADLRVVCLPS
jgi:hypothetical protein